MQFCSIYGCETILRTEYEKVTGMCEYCRKGEPNDKNGNVLKLSHDYYDFTSKVKKRDY